MLKPELESLVALVMLMRVGAFLLMNSKVMIALPSKNGCLAKLLTKKVLIILMPTMMDKLMVKKPLMLGSKTFNCIMLKKALKEIK